MTKLLKCLLIILAVGIIALTIYIFKYQSQPSIPKTPSPRPSPKATQIDGEMTFIFAGDAMFGRAVYAKYHDDLKVAFENLGEGFFKNKDIAILNLEGPIVENEFMPDTNPDNLMMKFPPQTKDALIFLGINTVSLANNHTDNQGQATLNFTREILNETKITTVGDPQNATYLVKTFNHDRKQISIIAVNILINTPELADLIKEQKNNDAFVIIFPHWGAEYQTTHNTSQEKLAHLWIDNGADMVIGSHPHVIQDAELYQEKPIFYSLGNFLFDQTFSQNTQRGLILNAKIKGKKLTLELIPIISNMQPRLLDKEEKENIISSLKKNLQDETGGDSIELNIK